MRVSIFITCLVDQLFPDVGEAMVATLRRLGVEVSFNAAQTCCGQVAFNTGYRPEAKAMAEHFVRTFEQDSADFIVAPSGSCTAMVRNYYGELFHGSPLPVGEGSRERGLGVQTLSQPSPKGRGLDQQWLDRFSRVRPRLREFSEFIVNELGVEDVGARFPSRVTYHDACHLLRELGISDQPRRLIRAVRDVDFVEMEAPDTCCGFGGTFSVKYGEISNAILQEKLARIANSGVEYVVANDSSCLMQIAGGLSRAGSPVKAMHLTELLAKQ